MITTTNTKPLIPIRRRAGTALGSVRGPIHQGNRKLDWDGLWERWWLVADCGVRIPIGNTSKYPEQIGQRGILCRRCFPVNAVRVPIPFPEKSFAKEAGVGQ